MRYIIIITTITLRLKMRKRIFIVLLIHYIVKLHSADIREHRTRATDARLMMRVMGVLNNINNKIITIVVGVGDRRAV